MRESGMYPVEMVLQREVVERQARWRPDEVALHQIDTGVEVTYAELDARANAFANALHDRGVRQGDRVVLSLYNTIEFPIALYGCHKRGIVPVATNYRWARDDFEFVFGQVQPSAAVYDVELAEAVESAASSVASMELVCVGGERPAATGFPELVGTASDERPPPIVGDAFDVSYVFYTSGTTGNPKAVAHSTRSARERTITSLLTSRMDAHSVCLILLPLFHGGGVDTTLRCVVSAGAELLMLRDPTVESAVDAIEEYGVTDVRSVPTITKRVVDLPGVAERDFSTVEHWRNTGAVLTESLARAFVRTVSPNLYNSYGSSECGNNAILRPEDLPERAGAAGRPVFGNEIRLIEPTTDREVAPHETVEQGEPGEVILRTDQMFTGYYDAGELSREQVRDGWYYTNDVGVVDEDGYLTIEGRLDDMLLSGGELVSVVEVEEAIEDHSNVVEAIVVGEQDEEWGQRVKAHVVGDGKLDDDTLEAELRDHCEDHPSLARYKRPRVYEFDDALEHTETGKKRRSSYRDR